MWLRIEVSGRSYLVLGWLSLIASVSFIVALGTGGMKSDLEVVWYWLACTRIESRSNYKYYINLWYSSLWRIGSVPDCLKNSSIVGDTMRFASCKIEIQQDSFCT